MNIANTVITHDNASLKSMNSGQVLDLFKCSSDSQDHFTEPTSSDVQSSNDESTAKQQSGVKGVLSDLGGLWNSQYNEEYNIKSFLKSMQAP